MHWFSDLTTRTKLLGAFAAVAIIILGVALVGVLGIGSLNAGTATLYSDRLLPVHELATFNDAQLEIRANLYGSILFPGDRSARERDVAALIASADGSLAQYEATYLVPEEVQGLARLKPAWVAYQQTVARTFGLADSGDVSGALDSVAAGGPVSAAEAALSEVISELIDVQLRVGVTIKQQGDRTFNAATSAMALAALIGVLLAISLAVVIARSISVPLARITSAARDVANGKLDAPPLADVRSRDEIGVLARTFGFMTGRLRGAQEALRESEERYRRITESITDYVFTVHVEAGQAGLTTHGVGCEPVTGYAPEELTAEPDLRLQMVVADDRHAALEQATRILRGLPVAPVEHRIVRKDGVLRWVRTTLVPQLGSEGNLVAYDGLVQDITERRTLQDELLEAQKMESIGRLAGGVAHDFNNLLTIILGNAEVALTELPADHPVRSGIEDIVNAGERASGLTRQLLAFASRQVIAPVRLDLSAVVAGSEEMLRLLLGDKIEVVTELGSSLDAVEADPGQVRQVLINLAMNAREAMPHGGRLVIETRSETVTEDFAATHAQVPPGRYVLLSVADTGLGMSDEVMRQVFEPFFTTKDLSEGAGLGLASCRGIVKQIGGDIRASSTPGQGTTFRILLPAIGTPATSSPGAGSPARPSTGSETVLVVEDEPSVRRLAVLCLRARGYSVHEAADGYEALEIVSRTPGIELVVSDAVMPGMNGPDLVARLLRQTPDVRVLLMSGYTEAPIVAGNLATRNLAFLAKPFTPEQIVRKVREVLDAAPDAAPLTGAQSLPAEGAAEDSGSTSPGPPPEPG